MTRNRKEAFGSGTGGWRGITLLELLAVIIILGLMLGLTIGILREANRDLGVSAATGRVVGLLRAAHQQSRAAATPAWVVLDPQQNSVVALSAETVGEWHLEDLASTGAFGRDAKVSGGTSVQGRVGKGVQLNGSGSIACMDVPTFAPDQGLAVEFWFLRRSGRGRATLFTIGDTVEGVAEADGRVAVKVGSLNASSGQIRLPLDAWCHFQLVYSGRDLRLLLNRREVASAQGRTTWVSASSKFVVGDSRSGLAGIVDEIRLGLVVAREPYYFPAEVTLELPAPPASGTASALPGASPALSPDWVVAFDSEGRLDPVLHRQPFKLAIKSPAAREDLVVGLSGTVSR